MPKTRPPYPPEFRAEAVRLVRLSGLPLPEVARELGVSPQSLRNWLGQAQIDAGERGGLTNDERVGLRRLRRDNVRLREEREILKKAATFLRAGDRPPAMSFRLIEAEEAEHAISRLCSVLGVTRAGY